MAPPLPPLLPSTISKKQRQNNIFLDDINRLIKISKAITNFNKVASGEISALDKESPFSRNDILPLANHLLQTLFTIGNECKNIYHEDDDTDGIRQKYAILPLNELEFLAVLPEATQKGLYNVNLLNDTVFGEEIRKDLSKLLKNVHYVLVDSKLSILRITSSAKEELGRELETELGTEIKNYITNLSGKEYAINLKSPLMLFIACFYLPWAIDQIVTILAESVFSDINWQERVDRYYFGRTFARVGELAKGMRMAFNDKDPSYILLHNMKKLRDTIKTKHLYFFADGTQGYIKPSTVNLLQEFIETQLGNNGTLTKALTDINQTLLTWRQLSDWKTTKDCITKQSNLDYNDANDVVNIKMLQEVLEGNNPYTKKLVSILKKASPLPPNANELSITGEELLTNYILAQRLLSTEEQKEYKLPKFNTKTTFSSYLSSIGAYCVKPSEPMSVAINNIFNIINKTKATIFFEKYKEAYDGVPAKFQGSFPPMELSAIQQWLKERPTSSPEKEETFVKLCRNYKEAYEETSRLAEIIAFPAASNQEKEKKRKEAAITHALGILGENMRYILELEEKSEKEPKRLSLKDLVASKVIKDLEHIHMVRDTQIMHGVNSYDPDVVFKTAKGKALSWKFDLKAVHTLRIHGDFEKCRTSNSNHLRVEAEKANISEEDFLINITISAGIAYVQLAKSKEAYSYLDTAKELLTKVNSRTKAQEDTLAYVHMTKATLKIGEAVVQTDTDIKESLFKEAESLLNDAKTRADFYKLKIFIRSIAAMFYCMQDNWTEMDTSYKEAIEISRKNGDYSEEEKLLFQKAQLLFNAKNKPQGKKEAIESMKQLLALPSLKENTGESVLFSYHINRMLAMFLSSENNAVEAKKYYEISINLFTESKELFKQALGASRYRIIKFYCEYDRASLYFSMEDYPKAEEGWNKCIKVIKKFGLKSEEEVNCRVNIANVYWNLALNTSSEKKVEYLKKAQEGYTNCINLLLEYGLKETLTEANAHAGMSLILAFQHRHKQNEYIDHHATAMVIFKKHGDNGERDQKKMKDGLYNIKINRNPQYLLTHTFTSDQSVNGSYNNGKAYKIRNEIDLAIAAFKEVITRTEGFEIKVRLDSFIELMECSYINRASHQAKYYHDEAKKVLEKLPTLCRENFEEFYNKTNDIRQNRAPNAPLGPRETWEDFLAGIQTSQQQTTQR